jgi:hypothetical protein
MRSGAVGTEYFKPLSLPEGEEGYPITNDSLARYNIAAIMKQN